MSASTSPATGRAYGLRRVCEVLGVPRSSLYAARTRDGASGVERAARKRGPVPVLDDAALLAKVRADLATSEFVGEGHRPVWARRTLVHGVRMSRKRVLRLMREHSLSSPNRQPRGESKRHEGTLVTDAPDRMWATDGATVETEDDGKVWVFVAVDHVHGECVGFHVAKHGTRFAAAARDGAHGPPRRGSVRRGQGHRGPTGPRPAIHLGYRPQPREGVGDEPELRPRRRTPDPRRRRAHHPHPRGAGRPRPRPRGRRRPARGGPPLRRPVQPRLRLANLGFRTPLKARASARRPAAASRSFVSKKPGALHSSGSTRTSTTSVPSSSN